MALLTSGERHHQQIFQTHQCYENRLRNSAPCFRTPRILIESGLRLNLFLNLITIVSQFDFEKHSHATWIPQFGLTIQTYIIYM